MASIVIDTHYTRSLTVSRRTAASHKRERIRINRTGYRTRFTEVAWIRRAAGETARFNEEVAINTTREVGTGSLEQLVRVTWPVRQLIASGVHLFTADQINWSGRTGCSRSQLFDVSGYFEVMFCTVISQLITYRSTLWSYVLQSEIFSS